MGYRVLTDERIVTDGAVTYLSLQNAIVTIDTDTLDMLLDYKWRFRESDGKWGANSVAVPDGATRTVKNRRYIRMPRLLMGVLDDPKKIVHVRSFDGKDMRRENLVVTTSTSVMRNRPECRRPTSGICWIPNHNWWQVYARFGGVNKYIGVFDDIEDAINARKQALRKMAQDAIRDRNGCLDGELTLTRLLTDSP